MIALSPGSPDVGRSRRTTVATAKGTPSAQSCCAFFKIQLFIAVLFRDAVVSETFPHFCRRNRNIDMAHTEVPQRIHDRIDYSCGRSHRCRLSDAFGSQWVMR